jgi:hypothetical protein
MAYPPLSKSKTFPKDTSLGELMDFVTGQIDTETHEVPYHLGMDIKIETVHKYIITITKVEVKNL